MADVGAFFGKMFTPKLITKINFFFKQIDFFKKAIFKKSEKNHIDSSKYYANFRYIIKVRNRKLREI